MPSPRKSSKSPGRPRGQPASPTKTKSRSRSRSAGRKPKSTAAGEIKTKVSPKRSRSRSAGRKPQSAVAGEVDTKTPVKKLQPVLTKSKSPSRTDNKEIIVTKKTITSTVLSSSLASSLERASVTPLKVTSDMVLRTREEERSDVSHRKLTNSREQPTMSTKGTQSENVAPVNKKPHYEFMGPVGAFFMLFSLPLTLYYVNITCSKGKCSILELPKLSNKLVASLFEVEATLIFLAWFFFQAFLAVLPVGKVVEGQPLKSGGRLQYRCNGFFALVVSLTVLGLAIYFKCPVTKVMDKFLPLMTAAIIFSFALSVFLYIKSRYVNPSKLAPGGNTGNVIYDFFIGRELNPRVGPLDLKFFCELRPGLIGWVVLDWIMVYQAFLASGTVSPNLLLVTAFQTLYVADALWFEEAILTTIDIIHDGFGFMLAFGDLAWVPFLYCLQPRFILDTKLALPWYCLAPIVAIKILGYAVFRLSNLEKNRYRNDPNHPAVSGLKTISTNTNKKLLVSGWWGLCRKPNYLGDLIMALSWSLTTGFSHVLPYFYPIYFLVLLVHRERRDYEQCRHKYGPSWDKYCQQVKYRIFPYIY